MVEFPAEAGRRVLRCGPDGAVIGLQVSLDLGGVLRQVADLDGDDDQIVPSCARAYLSSKVIKDPTLKGYPGAPHGLVGTSVAGLVGMRRAAARKTR